MAPCHHPGLCSDCPPPYRCSKVAGRTEASGTRSRGRGGWGPAWQSFWEPRRSAGSVSPVRPFSSQLHIVFLSRPSRTVVSLIFCVQWTFTRPLLKVIKKKLGRLHSYVPRERALGHRTDRTQQCPGRHVYHRPTRLRGCPGRWASEACRGQQGVPRSQHRSSCPPGV